VNGAAGRARWTIAVLAWVAALGAAAPFDLALSESVVDRTSPFGAFVYHYGGWPSLLAYGLGLAWLGLTWRRPVPWLPGLRHPSRAAALAVILMGLVQALALTHLIKHVWGRVRYVDLLSAADYTPFYEPAGVGVGASFPSGHTATAFALLPLPLALWRAGRRRAALVAGALALAWGAAVGWGRVAYGAHYLTDTLFSAGLALLLAPLLLRLSERLLGTAPAGAVERPAAAGRRGEAA
jgi:membrane-associated phospholipid phosphatase